MTDSPSAGGLAGSSGAPLPMAAVDHLDDIVGQLRRMDDLLGSGTLLALVQAHLRHVVELLDQRRYPESVGRRLHATAGELMRLAGWLAFDSGYLPTPITPRTPPLTVPGCPEESDHHPRHHPEALRLLLR